MTSPPPTEWPTDRGETPRARTPQTRRACNGRAGERPAGGARGSPQHQRGGAPRTARAEGPAAPRWEPAPRRPSFRSHRPKGGGRCVSAGGGDRQSRVVQVIRGTGGRIVCLAVCLCPRRRWTSGGSARRRRGAGPPMPGGRHGPWAWGGRRGATDRPCGAGVGPAHTCGA